MAGEERQTVGLIFGIGNKTATYPSAGGGGYTGNNIAAIILRNRQIRQQNVVCTE